MHKIQAATPVVAHLPFIFADWRSAQALHPLTLEGGFAGAPGVRRNEGQRRAGASGLYGAGRLARRGPPRCAGLSPARGGTAVPAHRHHLRGLRRGRRAGAADPVRRHSAHPGGGGMGRCCAAASSSASRPSTSYLRDIYGRREILRAGIVPEDLVFQNPVFRPEMNGQKVPHDIYVHIAGIDIVRVDADTFYVLEDNARTPSGVSYMLENREIMMRLFPELFSRHRVAPVENYPDELLATLTSVAPGLGAGRSDRRAAHARRLQFGLLRALVPGRQTRHRSGRRPRPVRRERHRLHAHDPGPQARRRDLPPHRRRLPRSARRSGRIRRSASPA